MIHVPVCKLQVACSLNNYDFSSTQLPGSLPPHHPASLGRTWAAVLSSSSSSSRSARPRRRACARHPRWWREKLRSTLHTRRPQHFASGTAIAGDVGRVVLPRESSVTLLVMQWGWRVGDWGKHVRPVKSQRDPWRVPDSLRS